MGDHPGSLLLRLPQSPVVVHDGARSKRHRTRLGREQQNSHRSLHVDICCGLRYVAYPRLVSLLKQSLSPTALGPLTMAPLCELYGRARVLQLSNLFYFGTSLPWPIP